MLLEMETNSQEDAPDFFIITPVVHQRQKLYKGHATVRARLESLIDAGELDRYSVPELAQMLGCSRRTVQCYIGMLTRVELADVVPDQLPLKTTRGRMLIMIGRHYSSCSECPCEELCNYLVRNDALVACEMPLADEIVGR